MFEKEYYEKISGIEFPEHYEVLETFDNGEWLTGTVFKIDSFILRNLVNEYGFEIAQNVADIDLFSSSYFTKFTPVFDKKKHLYYPGK